MSQSPFAKVIMATQSTPEFDVAYGEERVYLLENPYKYCMQPELHLPHYRCKGHSTKHANNDSSLAHTKKRKAKRRLNKKHNK